MSLVMQALRDVFTGVNYFIFFYVLFVSGFYFLLFLVSALQLRKLFGLEDKSPYSELLESSFTPPVSILVPAYNEEAGIVASVRSLLATNYPNFEIIVVNDGSKDRTLETMLEAFSMKKVQKAVRKSLETQRVREVYISEVYPDLILLDKENGGKADALNAGINVSQYPYFCSLDADSVLERDAFLKVMKPIIDSDGDVICSGGSVRIANGCRIERGEVLEINLPDNKYAVMQVIEYMRAFLMGRIGFSRHNMLLIVSGAFGVFNKDIVVRAGGYRHDTVGEDMELIVRLHRFTRENKMQKRTIIYVPDPVCWTEAPEDASILRKQRSRWQRGLMDSLRLHKRMFFNPRYGLVGLISFPYFFFVEMMGPLIEAFGYLAIVIGLATGRMFLPFAASLLLLSILNGSLLSAGAVLLEEWSLRKYPRVSDLTKLCLYALTETFWYRPLNTYWRLEGTWQFLRKQQGWGDMKRKGVSN
ncbi:glycosyltransferase family 2 protein [Tumebacillus flagellatus]|nr:glycosyltransferase [Tumebacillus flagellatus]